MNNYGNQAMSGAWTGKLLRNVLLGGACFAALTSTPALAQSDQGSVETVVVTGIRGSLQQALDIKRNSVGIVDAITAEDIGKFPDVNLADAMMRIPGITVTRGRGTASGGTGGTSTNGQATEITVRGFGPTFNETLFDGRQVATGTGDRAFDFSQVNSDFVSQIDVMKTPDASLSSGAIGATINVKFPKPFDHPGLVIAGGLSGTVSPDRGKLTPNGDILISDTFDHDRFGILVDASYADTQTRENHINTQGWEGKYASTLDPTIPGQIDSTYGAYPTTAGGQVITPTQGLTTPTWFIQDYGIYHELDNNEREQARIAVQWRPTDDIEITLNDNYSRDNDHQMQYGYSVWFNNGSMTNVQLDKNGSVVDFQQTTPTDFQAQYNPQSLKFNDYGVNVKWNVSDKLLVTVDADHSDGWSNPSRQMGIDADIGYGNTLDNAVLGIAVPGGHAIPYPTGFGPNNNESQFINNGIIGSHVVPLNIGYNLDSLNQAKIEGDWTDRNIDLKFGFQYVAEHKNEALEDDFSGAVGVGNNNWQAYAGYGPASGNAPGNGVALPQSLFAKSFSTSGFINGWTGAGNLPPAILQANPFAILSYLNSLNGAGASTTCCSPAFTGTYAVGPEPGSTHYLREQTYSGFMEATFKTDVATMPLQVNIGTRYDITSEDVTGFGQTVAAFHQASADATSWTAIYSGAPVATEAQHQYQYLLPSLDMTLSVTDDLDVRFNASRTLTRPPISQLDPVFTIGASRVGDVTQSGGNSDLLPYLSDNLDLGAQWYYAPNSYVSVDTFLKSVDNFIINKSVGADFGPIGVEYEDPVTKVPFVTPKTGIDVPYTITSPINGPAANVYGIELAWQHVFGDSGYGYEVNGTIVGTNSPYDPNNLNISGFAVTGLADSANFMVFYDKHGFQARLAANWQDSYLDHFGQIQNGSSFGTEPTFVNGSWNLDFSTSYDITSQVSVYAEAMNLTDATYSTHGRFSNQVLDIVDYGRRFLFGVHFKY